MKRKIYNLIVFLLVLAILTCNVYAAVSATIKVTATKTQLKKGEDFKVTLSLDNVDSNKSVTSVVGYINVNTSVLEKVKFEDINKDGDGTVTIGNEKLIVEDLTDKSSSDIPDTVYCVSFNGHPVSGNQSKLLIDMKNGLTSNSNLVTIDFHVKDDADVGTFEDAISYKMFVVTEGDEVTPEPGITKNIGIEVSESEVKNVTYSPKATDTVSLKTGETKQYKATYDGNDVTESTKITWELDGTYKSGTKIEKGLLTVASDETATEIKFKAKETLSSDEGTTTEFKVTVSKSSEEDKKVVFSPSSSDTVSLKKGESKQYKVTYDGNDVTSDPRITWTLDGTYKSGTKIEKGLLKIASDETATEIKFKVKETISSDEGTTTSFKVLVSDSGNTNTNTSNTNTSNSNTSKSNTSGGTSNTSTTNSNTSKGGSSSSSGGSSTSSKTDNTVAPSVLPKTGTGRMLFGFIIIGGIAIISYKEYRKMREI